MVAAGNGIVQLFYPDHNWRTFWFPPELANRPGWRSFKQAALINYFAGALSRSAVTVVTSRFSASKRGQKGGIGAGGGT